MKLLHYFLPREQRHIIKSCRNVSFEFIDFLNRLLGFPGDNNPFPFYSRFIPIDRILCQIPQELNNQLVRFHFQPPLTRGIIVLS